MLVWGTLNGQLIGYTNENSTIDFQPNTTDRIVFTFTVSGSNYTFTLLDQVDHPSLDNLSGDNSQNSVFLNLGAGLVLTDADGDSVSVGVIVEIIDDIPVAVATGTYSVSGTVEEDGMSLTASVVFRPTARKATRPRRVTPIPTTTGRSRPAGLAGLFTVGADETLEARAEEPLWSTVCRGFVEGV